MRRALHRNTALLGFLLTVAAAGCRSGDTPTAHSELQFGVRMAQRDLWREARFRFQRAAEIDPSDAMAQNNLAVALEGTGDFERAKAAYVQALRLDAGNQYIQKNYSRFMEFYTRNDRKDKPAAPPPAQVPARTPSSPPATGPGTSPMPPSPPPVNQPVPPSSQPVPPRPTTPPPPTGVSR